jgi:hypothetical protein
MTITLDLTAEEEARLRADAAVAGISDPAQYVRRLINTAPRRTGRPQTGAELADALEALNLPAGYGDPDIDAPELARQLAARFSRPNREATL